jgi:hypothetical protein
MMREKKESKESPKFLSWTVGDISQKDKKKTRVYV